MKSQCKLLYFFSFFLFQIIHTKKAILPPRLSSFIKYSKFHLFERQLFFTMDPRPHNDDVLMKKIVADNEKIHLLKKLTSNLSMLDKVELIAYNKDKIFPIHINPDNLLEEWNFDEKE